jgi:hypothetical protein
MDASVKDIDFRLLGRHVVALAKNDISRILFRVDHVDCFAIEIRDPASPT